MALGLSTEAGHCKPANVQCKAAARRRRANTDPTHLRFAVRSDFFRELVWVHIPFAGTLERNW